MMENKMDKFLKKVKRIAIISLSFLLVFLMGLFVLLTNSLNQKSTSNQNVKPTIALVNEDLSSNFNNQKYNFGKDFVDLVSNDSKYNWQVVSRPVADKAYADKSIDAVIYIPQSFSRDILTLQDLDPTKAEVDYKVLPSTSELSERLLQDKIMNILYDFNQNIVKMYYASVAGNVAEAQGNMTNVVGSQGTLLSQLNHQVYSPFQTTNQNYSSVVSVAISLQGMNSSWIEAQNAFTNSTKSMLQSESSSLTAQLSPLQTFFNTQKKIADINTKNGNLSITNQAKSDLPFYYNQFTSLYGTAKDSLNDFYSSDGTTETGQLANLKAQVKSYSTLISSVKSDLEMQKTKLDAKRNDLYELEKQLYQNYFNQELTIDATNYDGLHAQETADNARTAMAEMILRSFTNQSNLPSNYTDQIKTLLGNCSWNADDYKNLFDALGPNGNGTFTQEQIDNYNTELGVVNNYGQAVGATSGTVDFIELLTDKTNQTVSGSLKITVPAGTTYKLTLPTGLDNFQWDSTDPDLSLDTDGTEKITNSNPKPKTLTLPYRVNLGDKDAVTLDFEWVNVNDASEVYQSTTTLGLIPKNQLNDFVGTKICSITKSLNALDTAANLIKFIYGAPNSSLKDLPQSTNLADFENASTQSVYYLYGNLSLEGNDMTKRLEQLKAQLSYDDVNAFLATGQKTIQSIIDTLKTLNLTIDGGTDSDGTVVAGLTVDIESLSHHLPNDYFAATLQSLQDWVSNAKQSLADNYGTWKANAVTPLPEKPWEEYSSEDTAIYYDKKDSDQLYQTISELVTSSAKSADDVVKNAQAIKDNADSFNSLVTTVKTTQDSAQKVIDNTRSLLSDGNSKLANSKNYSDNFNSVLANTRTAGANPNSIFDFFAHPLNTKDLTSKNKVVSAKGFDWRLVIVFLAGITIGALALLVANALRTRRETKQLSQSEE